MRQKNKIRTGELNRRLKYYGVNISKRQLQRLAQNNRLPVFLQYYERPAERPSGPDYKREMGGNYKWDWTKIEKAIRNTDIETVVDYIQSKHGGNRQKIKTRVAQFLGLMSFCGIPYVMAFRYLYWIFSMSMTPELWEETDRLWRQKVAPKLMEKVSKKLKRGNLGLLDDWIK
jgi:hypothetical protein